MRRHIWIFVMLCGCGEPILKNAPKPDPGAVAGVAAAAAAAVTLADPQAAGRRQEQKTRGEPDNRGVEVKETVPSDVLDRLDHRPDAGSEAAAPAQPAQPPSPAPSGAAPAVRRRLFIPPPTAVPVPPPAAIPLSPASP